MGYTPNDVLQYVQEEDVKFIRLAFCVQQLKSLPRTFVYYYSNDNSTLEIDFVVQHDTHHIFFYV